MSSALDAATARLAANAVAPTFTRTRPAVSVVIPTRNEAGNIVPLMDALAGVLSEHGMEVIFVDDSDDGTDAVIREPEPGKPPDRATSSTAWATSASAASAAPWSPGWSARSADWVCVMDADLQHPPALVSELFERAGRGDVDIVVASRFAGGGSAEEFGPLRTAALPHVDARPPSGSSRGSSARRHRSDERLLPGAAERARARRVCGRKGFKILLEILVRTRQLRMAEVPFAFGVRHSGESKASAAEGARYLGQLWRLRFADVSARFGRFGVVGLTGLVVNTLAAGAPAATCWACGTSPPRSSRRRCRRFGTSSSPTAGCSAKSILPSAWAGRLAQLLRDEQHRAAAAGAAAVPAGGRARRQLPGRPTSCPCSRSAWCASASPTA